MLTRGLNLLRWLKLFLSIWVRDWLLALLDLEDIEERLESLRNDLEEQIENAVSDLEGRIDDQLTTLRDEVMEDY